MNIQGLFNKYKVRITEYKYDFINKNNFPKELTWVYELLILIPLQNQTEREESVNNLPEGLIRVIFELFQKDDNRFFEWLTGPKSGSKETYYATLIHELFEGHYLDYTREETLPETLKYYREEAERMIEENLILAYRYLENKDNIKLPVELSFLIPFLSMVDKDENVENFEQNIPGNFIDLSHKMVGASSDLRKRYLKKEHAELEYKINILNEAEYRQFNKMFAEIFNEE